VGYLTLIALFTTLLTTRPDAGASTAQPPDLTSPVGVTAANIYYSVPRKTAPDSTPVVKEAQPSTIVVTPRAIRIPALNVTSSDVAPMGLKPDNTLQTPPLSKAGSEAGWYDESPVPGDTGPSIVVAHIDGNGKLGLFAHLSQLQAGDQVQVDRSDGQTATFTISRVLTVDKKSFPSQLVYGDTPDAELRMVTCGGLADPVHHRYLGQTIVFARLTGMTPTE
jgi:LPXTG-site transpeptidase (sortase) family protein